PPPAFTATGPALVDCLPAIVQSSSSPRAGIMSAPARPSGTFGKDATAPVIAPALAPRMAPILAPMSELSNTFCNSQFLLSSSLQYHSRTSPFTDRSTRFSHTSMAMVDSYAGLFELRVFKNQYSIEFLLPTGEH
ncbi:19735_t:CDS:2, partial [Funneliformis geosporum]